jgi:hypothetical protein
VAIATAEHHTGALGHPARDGPDSDLIAGAGPVSGLENQATDGT